MTRPMTAWTGTWNTVTLYCGDTLNAMLKRQLPRAMVVAGNEIVVPGLRQTVFS